MILKMTGMFLVVVTSTFLGVQKADAIREEYRQMGELQKIIYRMESEIRYAKAHLGEIFSHIASDVKGPYKEWLLYLKQQITSGEAVTFSKLWSQSVDQYLTQTRLPKRELSRLKQLGSQMGTADLTFQLKLLELYQKELSESMEDVRKEMQNKIRICQCMGAVGGVFLVILLL